MKKEGVFLALVFLYLVFIPSLCFALPVEKSDDILKLTLAKETVIAPDQQSLTILISKPMVSTPKEFQLKLDITGPALFDNNLKEKVIEYAQISENLNLNQTIRIDNSASGLGETINISYMISYKSSFLGKIDENFRVFQGSLSFRGAATEKAACETNLNNCNIETTNLNRQISSLNSQIAEKDNEINSLKSSTACQQAEQISCRLNNYIIAFLVLVIIGIAAYKIYKVVSKRKEMTWR